MKHEFNVTKFKDATVYTLESATSGGTSAGNGASVSSAIGGVRRRGDNLIAQEEKKEAPKPRNFVAKNAKMGGAGQHKDKKKEQKQGNEKHKKPYMEDHEVSMASSELKSIHSDAQKLLGLVQQYGQNGDLQAWQQSKITKAADYLNSVLQSISSEQDASEAYGRYDRRDAYQRDYDHSVAGMGKRQSQAYQDDGGANDERHDLDPSDWYIVKDGKMFKVSVYPNQEQEAMSRGYSRTRDEAKAKASEQGVAEVSKATLDRYVPKAVDAHGHADFSARSSKDDPTLRSYHVDQKKTAEKRRQGISRALDRMSKTEAVEDRTSYQVAKVLHDHGIKYDPAREDELIKVIELTLVKKLAMDPRQVRGIMNDEDFLGDTFGELRQMEQGVGETSDYMMELAAKLAEKIPKNAPVDVWIKDFEKSTAPQFKGKNLAKRRQMAIAASYGAKNPSKKK